MLKFSAHAVPACCVVVCKHSEAFRYHLMFFSLGFWCYRMHDSPLLSFFVFVFFFRAVYALALRFRPLRLVSSHEARLTRPASDVLPI